MKRESLASARLICGVIPGLFLLMTVASSTVISSEVQGLADAASDRDARGAGRTGMQNTIDAVLGLDACLELALSNSRAISIADRQVLISRDQRLEAIGGILPRIQGSATFLSRNNDSGFDSDQGEFIVGDRNTFLGQIQLLVPLYDFGDSRQRLKAANLGIDASRQKANRVREDIALAVTLSYFRILEAQKIRTVVEESITVLDEQLNIANDYFLQGLVAKNDLLVAEVQLARRRQQLIRVKNNIELATSSLNRLIGLPLTRPTTIEDALEVHPWRGELEPLVKLALESRSDLVELRDRLAISRAAHKASKTAFFPRFFGFGNANATSDSDTLNKTWFSAGVGMRLTLFDTSSYARIRSNRRAVEQAQELHDDQLEDVKLQVQQAHSNLMEAIQLLPVARKGIEQAEENLRMIRDQYGEGIAKSTDVLVEEERLALARSDYYQSLYAYHQSFARLVHAIGAEPNAWQATPALDNSAQSGDRP